MGFFWRKCEVLQAMSRCGASFADVHHSAFTEGILLMQHLGIAMPLKFIYW